jgi:DNA-binding NarL/FixJ family response regulator
VAKSAASRRVVSDAPATGGVSCALIGGDRLFLDLLGDTLRLRRGLRITCFDQRQAADLAAGGGEGLSLLVIDFDSLDEKGRSAATAVSDRYPGISLLVVAARAKGLSLPAALARRRPTVVGKDESFATFLSRLEEACGQRLPAIDGGLNDTRRHASLTAREAEIFSLLADGLTTEEIATRLSRSFYTIQTHRKRIGEKLGRLGHPIMRRAVAHREATLRSPRRPSG